MQFPRCRSPRTFSVLLTVGLCTGSAAALASLQANAENEALLDISATGLFDTEVASTTIPLTNSFAPNTPWPVVADISQTVLQSPHDLLSYIGVETSARNLLNGDYATWRSHFGARTETSALSNGLLMASACLKPCSIHKSLLIVNPATQKVYAAMVTEGKVAMWPSLMAWPDEAVPALKDWLADAADGD